MSEIKGQLLGVILVLMVFGIISATITTVFTSLKDQVSNKTTYITDDLDSYYPEKE